MSVAPRVAEGRVAFVAAGSGMLNRFPSGSPQRVPLRTRLTLIRRALIRNPWSFGVRDFHPHYRYSCLHLLFRPLHRGSPLRLRRGRNAPLPTLRSQSPMASAGRLCPIIIHAPALDQ